MKFGNSNCVLFWYSPKKCVSKFLFTVRSYCEFNYFLMLWELNVFSIDLMVAESPKCREHPPALVEGRGKSVVADL